MPKRVHGLLTLLGFLSWGAVSGSGRERERVLGGDKASPAQRWLEFSSGGWGFLCARLLLKRRPLEETGLCELAVVQDGRVREAGIKA